MPTDTFNPANIWHTGKYNIQTDGFEGGGVACFVGEGLDERIIEARTIEELRHKYNDCKNAVP